MEQLFLQKSFENEWELTKSPAGAHQWVAKNGEEIIPDAFDSTKNTDRQCLQPICR